jgi:alpha-tubulin N-acetyltransferase 1
MLKKEGIPVEHFAIDGPTDMFLAFLSKHYGESKMIPQLYNFALFDGFFTNRAGCTEEKAIWNGVGQEMEKPKKRAQTVLEDSRNYNNHPSLHLRNGQQLPNSNSHGYSAQNARNTQPWP